MFNSSVFRILCAYLILWPSVWGWYYISIQMPPKGTHLYVMGYIAPMVVTLLMTLGLLSRDRSITAYLQFGRWQVTALLLFLISAVLGPLLSAPNTAYAYLRLMLFLPLVLSGFAAYIWFQTLNDKRAFQIALAFIMGMLLHAIMVIPFLQPYIDSVDLVNWTSGIVPFFNVRRYTNYFAVAIPVMTGLWVWASTLKESSTWSPRFLAALALLGLSTFWTIQFWAGSRAPTLAVLCAITTMAYIARDYRRPLIAGSVIAIVIGAVASLFLPRPTPFFGFWSRMFDAGQYESLNRLGSGRMGVWQEAWRLFMESPVFGNGHAQFIFQDGLAGKMSLETPHNFPLEMLNDFGLVGGLAILFLVYGGVLRLMYQASRTMMSPATVMAMLALLTMSAQSLFDGNISPYLSVIPFGLFWALAASSVKRDLPRHAASAHT